MRLAGVLLAAGRGERMRQAVFPFSGAEADLPKPLVPLAGKPLCCWAAEALARAGDDLRLAVVPPGGAGEQIRAALNGLGFHLVTNPEPERGLLSSFQAAVMALPAEIEGAVFALADMPFVSAETHVALRRAGASAVAAQCCYGPVKAPPLFLRAELFAELLALPAVDAGPRSLLAQHGAVMVPRAEAELLDIDTPETLALAAAALDAGR